MADFNSSLPVRTEANGDLAVKVVDKTTTSQAMAVDANGLVSAKISDGSGNAITSQVSGAQRAMDVQILVSGTVKDPTQVRALTATDVVSSRMQDGAGTALTSTLQGAKQSLHVAVVNSGGTIVDPTQIRALAYTTDFVAVKGSTGNQLAVNADGSINVSAGAAGTPVLAYNTASAIAAAGTSNHDYTVTAGKTFTFKGFSASASGRMKIEVQLETAAASGVFNTKFVVFSSADAQISQAVFSNITQVASAKVRIIRTNLDKSAMDVYSTIEGSEA